MKEAPPKGMLGDSWTQWDNTFYAAKYLADTRNFDGKVALVFQPAEEGLGGARYMIEDGCLDKVDEFMDYIFGIINFMARWE